MIDQRRYYKTNSRSINIRPFGDLQIGDPGFRKDLWEQWKADAKSDPTSLIIGMGDYLDTFRFSQDIAINGVMDSGSRTKFDTLMMVEMEKFVQELKPFANRIIGLHTGHHTHALLSGGNLDTYLCGRLKVPYLNFAATNILNIDFSSSRHDIRIFSTHGQGSSKKVSSDIAQVENMIAPSWDVDIIIRGHSTKVFCVNGNIENKPMWDENKKIVYYQQRSKLLVNSGGFSDGYIQGTSGYVEHKNLPPCALGYAVITIHLHANYVKGSKNKQHNHIEIKGTTYTG